MTAGSAIMVRPRSGWAADIVDPRVADIAATTIGIDTHNHVDVPLTSADMPGPDINLRGEMKRSGLSAICMTFATDYQRGDAYDRFLNGLTSMDRQLQRNGMKRSLTPADVHTSHKNGQPTVIQAVEGGHFLQGHLERVEEAHKRGLRHFGLLHDSDAPVPLGDVYTNPPRYGGLTSFGAAVIKECNRLGILIDLAHADVQTTRAALKATKRPVIISHTGLDTQLGSNPSMAQLMRPRLISKEQARMVADAGGLVGVWTHLADTPLDMRGMSGRWSKSSGWIMFASARIPSSPSPAAVLTALATVNSMRASGSAPIRHGRIKRRGSTTLLSMRCLKRASPRMRSERSAAGISCAYSAKRFRDRP
jgi:membrane dipeptidase